MISTKEKIITIIEQYDGDKFLPKDAIKQCIQLLEQASEDYAKQIELLRSQIGIWGSDDTSMFSRQLTASRLADALFSKDTQSH